MRIEQALASFKEGVISIWRASGIFRKNACNRPQLRMEGLYMHSPLTNGITPEITRYKVILQHINPFIGITEDFVSFIDRYSDYFTVTTGYVAETAEQ